MEMRQLVTSTVRCTPSPHSTGCSCWAAAACDADMRALISDGGVGGCWLAGASRSIGARGCFGGASAPASRRHAPSSSQAAVAIAFVGAFASIAMPRAGAPWSAHRRRSLRHVAVRAAGGDNQRRVKVALDFAKQETMPLCTESQLSKIFAVRAPEVFFGGEAEAAPGQEGALHVYLPPFNVGLFNTQTRLICELCEPRQGRAEVRGTDISLRVKLMNTTSEVIMRWRQTPDGVRVTQEVSQRLLIKVPAWFPVPDSVLESMIRPFVVRLVRASQAGVFQRLRKMLAAESSPRLRSDMLAEQD